jgi:PTH1 family peptidyl-tRNA hydrolase
MKSWFKKKLEKRAERITSNQPQSEERNSDLFIIAGLGNPTAQYVGTRHNVGFEAIDVFANKYNIEAQGKKFNSYIGKGMANGHKVLLVKPQTYMNLSGQSVQGIVDYFRVDKSSRLIVIADDVNLDVGQIRIRQRGSSGGQKGLSSIINHLGTEEFIRIRIGVGEKSSRMSMSNYVLSQFTKEECEVMEDSYTNCTKAIEDILDGNIEKAMNLWNRKKRIAE